MAIRARRPAARPRRAARSAVSDRGVPGARRRIDQHREAAPPGVAEPQEQPRGQAGRRAGVGLRLVAIGHRQVEDMRAEAALRGVAAVRGARPAPARAASRRPAAGAEIIHQLGMAALVQRAGRQQLVEVHRHRVVARQAAEEMPGHLHALRVEHVQPQRQRVLRGRHRRRLDQGAEARPRQHRQRQQIAAAQSAPAATGMFGSGARSARSTFAWAMRVRPSRTTS